MVQMYGPGNIVVKCVKMGYLRASGDRSLLHNPSLVLSLSGNVTSQFFAPSFVASATTAVVIYGNPILASHITPPFLLPYQLSFKSIYLSQTYVERLPFMWY
jgi:hypothetical protein